MSSTRHRHILPATLLVALGFTLAGCGDTGPSSTPDAEDANTIYENPCQAVVGGVAKCSLPSCLLPRFNGGGYSYTIVDGIERGDRLCVDSVNTDAYRNPAPGFTCDPEARDCDGDGIPDVDEMFSVRWARVPSWGLFGANYPTKFYSADSDGDSLNDLEEIQQGTDPTDPDDPFTRSSNHKYTGGEVVSVVRSATIRSAGCCDAPGPDYSHYAFQSIYPPGGVHDDIMYLLDASDAPVLSVRLSEFPTVSLDPDVWNPGVSDNVHVALVATDASASADDTTAGEFSARITQTNTGDIRIRAHNQSFTITLDPSASEGSSRRAADPQLNAMLEALGDEVQFDIHQMFGLGTMVAASPDNDTGDVRLSTAASDTLRFAGAVRVDDITAIANRILSLCLTPDHRSGGFLATVASEETSALALACRNDVTFNKVEFDRDGLAGFCADLEDARYDLCHHRFGGLFADVDTDNDDVMDAFAFEVQLQLSDTATAPE